nr:phytase [Lysobacter psychrotolerans]
MNLTSTGIRLIGSASLLLLLSCASTAPAATAGTSAAATVGNRDAQLEPDEGADHDPLLAREKIAHAVVAEAFVSVSMPEENLDSPVAWVDPDRHLWVAATSKQGDRLALFDGATGATRSFHGSSGGAPGQFRRPNGIFAIDSMLMVVERDNHRVQVLALPSLALLGTFGMQELVQPYGMWARTLPDGAIDVLVTDAYMDGVDAAGEGVMPALAKLDRRVQRYRVERHGDAIQARHVGSIGDTAADGAIRIPESIWGDPAHDRLLIAEEDVTTGTAVREYDLQGRYRQRTIGLDRYKAQAEGIALWQCADGSGYWISTDQFKDRSLFHVWDRASLEHLGAFAGKVVANTDGVWLHQAATPAFPAGVFYAVHDDQAVAAFDWRDVARALNLRERCA